MKCPEMSTMWECGTWKKKARGFKCLVGHVTTEGGGSMYTRSVCNCKVLGGQRDHRGGRAYSFVGGRGSKVVRIVRGCTGQAGIQGGVW
jgi:hypothetical protein